MLPIRFEFVSVVKYMLHWKHLSKIKERALCYTKYTFSLKQKKEVEDQSDGCGAKFSVIVVSDAFEGKPLLQRHRLVNAVLEEELKTIHAFSQKTLTQEQWEKQKS